MATIKVIQNGPYLVQGDDVTVVDWNGATYAIGKRPFALCRCGGSTTKPFCDGTHSRARDCGRSRSPGQPGQTSHQTLARPPKVNRHHILPDRAYRGPK